MQDTCNLRLDRPALPQSLFDLAWLVRCRVKILIVTDWSGGFGEQGFHIGHVLDTLADDPWSHIVFDITKAHRQMSGEAQVIDNFRFDAHDLGQYSQIWLFGVHRNVAPLSAAELSALADFMEAGGGVFATGDHEDLGLAMCGAAPRVRSMRRWHFPNPGPNGEPVAPAQSTATRHDTVMNLAGGGNQSDSIPQPIRPRWYSVNSGGGIIKLQRRFPHPLLCGPEGVITHLPDHMHEGVCEVPTNLDADLLPGRGEKEYPEVGGVRPLPEVIAWATSRNTDNREFGVLAAYDGHRIQKGRVVVDATWHHWFNINLVGFVAASDPANPAFDPTVVPKWREIQAFFRNIGVWLARPSLQTCIRNGGWLWTLGSYDVQMTIRDLKLVKDPLIYYWQIGVFARDALGRIASRCQTTRWIVDFLARVRLPFRIDPWQPIGLRDPAPIDPPDWLDLGDFEAVVLGAGLHAAMEKFSGLASRQARERLLEEGDGAAIEKVMLAATGEGVAALAGRMEPAPKQARELREAFGQLR